MTVASKQQEKLISLLRELFQLNQPDLDFGLYRIMHAKSQQIEKFLSEDLLGTIQQTFTGGAEEKAAQAKVEYEAELANAIKYRDPDPENNPAVKEKRNAWELARNSQGEDAEIYDHLYRFFERYYDSGDFLSRRYYARETHEKAAPYAIPYDGSEVYLHWANKDQYYIKSSEYFNQFTFDLARAQDDNQQLWQDTSSRKVHFKLVDVEEGEHNNVKSSTEKDRYFIVDAEKPLEWIKNSDNEHELVVRFHYRADPERTGQAAKWRVTRNEKNEKTILDAIREHAQDGEVSVAQAYFAELSTPVNKGNDGKQTLLAKYLNQYTAKNSMDYFIHKDLGGFLRRELDFYIKNEMLRLDDLGTAEHPQPDHYAALLKKLLILRNIAFKLIDFLAQTEDFQKALWLKKKFVVDTQWLVTLDKVPVTLHPKIKTNEEQWDEWVKLGFVNKDADRDALMTADSRLVLDTQFFAADFTAELLASIPNLDEATDGVLIHSENFQALNLMQERYREQITGIYIDPPYNTDASEIVYKNGYKDSSWCSLLHDRLNKSKTLLKQNAPACVTIDECEVSNLQKVMESSLGGYKIRPLIIEYNHRGRVKSNFAITHEYALWALPEGKDVITRKREISEDIRRNLRRTGTDSERKDAPKQFYGIEVDNNTLEIVSVTASIDLNAEIPKHDNLNTTMVWPIDDKGIERRWYYGRDRVELDAKEGTVWAKRIKGEIQIHYHQDGKPKMRKSVWVGKLLDASTYGSELLNDLFGLSAADFSFPKSIHAVSECLESMSYDATSIFLDFFSGSGTTGHAVINLNREDNGKRKYVLVEMGNYFNSVTKPRITKVVYSAGWKDGKPIALETGISQLVKVIRLESYEDTLNNLQLLDKPDQKAVFDANPAIRETYFLHYLLELETQGSPSLLNVGQFSNPVAYTLNIKKPGTDGQEQRTVDLVETFNWLIGLRVSKLHAPQNYAAELKREVDASLPVETATRLVLQGRLQLSADGAWWFRSVEGLLANKQRVLVVWRKLTGDLEQDNTVLEAYLREFHGLDFTKPESVLFDMIYVNGSTAIASLPHCEIRLLENEFHRLMWAQQDV